MDSYQESQRQLARPYRKAVLRALLVFTFVAGILFFLLNMQRGNHPLAFAEIGMALYAAVIFRAVRNTRHLERWVLAYLLPFFITMMFALTTPRATSTVFAWVLLIPILAHLLTGRRQGLLISGIFMTIAAVIFYLKHRGDPTLMQAIPIANIGIMSLCILAFSHIYEITREQSEQRLLKLAQTDPLTGLANRARLADAFELERRRSLRQGTPLSALILDLDHFKRVNDDHGHDTGDRALRHVAGLLQTSLRRTDLAARLGGEEFVLLLSDTSLEQARVVADKIRQNIEQTLLVIGDTTLSLTVSGGVAEYGIDGDSLKALVRRADARLYHAKATGRNRIVGAGELDDERQPLLTGAEPGPAA